MKNKFLLSALIVSLTACSGGGGGGNAGDSSGSPSASDGTPYNIGGTQYTVKTSLLNVAQDNSYISPTVNTQLFNAEKQYAVKPAATRYAQDIADIFELTNQYRTEVGLSPLVYDEKLMAYAQKRAEELVGYYSHTRPDGTSFATGLSGGGAENISYGQKSGTAAAISWKNSPGHYANMIHSDLSKIGIGVVYSPSGDLHWVQVFGFDGTSSDYYLDDTLIPRDTFENVTAHLSNATDKLKYLVVDDFPILIQDISPNNQWYSFSQSSDANSYSGVMNGYSSSRFGLVQQQNAKYQAFYTGNETELSQMPTSGSATYQGKAVMTDGSNTQYLNAQFLADFGNKKLSGALSQNGTALVDVQAHIEGKAFRSPTNATVEAEGVFFGTQAEELGGVFYDHSNNKYGAFGAKK